MKNLSIFIGLLPIIVAISGCPKPCIETSYSFHAYSQIIPDADSIKLGDTVFVSATFSTRLTDQQSGAEIDYNKSTGIESTLSITELVAGDSIPRGAVYDFNYVSKIGAIYNATSIPSPERVQQLKYQEIGANYELRIGIIPRNRGIFALGIGNGLSNGREKTSRCEKASFEFTITNSSQHIYYFRNWRPGYNLSAYDTLKLYCFKVY